MNTEFIVSYLQKEFGGMLTDTGWREAISGWEQWYRGEVDGFHDVVVNNGLSCSKRKLFRLNMAKKVAEDWADMLLNEKTYVVIGDRKTSLVLQGEDGSGGILGENDFWTTANRLIEKTFALGTGAIIVYLENARLDREGNILPSPEARIRTDAVDARYIFPVSWQGDRITEVCFAGEIRVRGEKRLYLQIHKLEPDGYTVYGRCLRATESGWEETALPEGIPAKVKTGSRQPWFAIFRPNTANHLFPSLPFGLPVFADCTDVLKGVDLCYDSLNMEFWLGRKMVFLRKDLLARDGAGNLLSPQDMNKQLFMYIGDKALDGDMLPKEFNPELRVSEHVAALNEQLNCLSVKCGLGEGHYVFDSKTGLKTATQVVSDNSNLFRTVRKHEIAVEKPLISTIKAILGIAAAIYKDIEKETPVSVCFDDSVIEDKSSEQSRDIELIRAGVLLPWEFRVKYYGEDAETAKAMLSVNKRATD